MTASRDRRWVLAVDHGTSTTAGAAADVDPNDGWLRVGAVPVDGSGELPSAVLTLADGTVLAGRPALEHATQDPGAVVLRSHAFLASATGGTGNAVLSHRPYPVTAVDAATALIARVFHTAAGTRGTLPSELVLTHPASWGAGAREALTAAGRTVLSAVRHASDDSVVLVPAPEAAAVRLGGEGPLVVVDIGGGGTEVAVVDRGGAGRSGTTVRPGTRTAEVGAESLDDALAQLVLDRARPELAGRIRFSGDPDAQRAWFTLRTGMFRVTEALGREATVAVTLPVLPPENPGPSTVTLTQDDLARVLSPGLEEIAGTITAVVGPGEDRPPLLVRGGIAALPGVRDWLARRTGLDLAAADAGALAPAGMVFGAAAWGAQRIGLASADPT